jgi:hypothetical protein
MAIVPILDDFIARGIGRLITDRPGAAPHVTSQEGRYFDVFAGWRAQLVLLRRRLIDECRARRLPTSEGQALVDLCRSEFLAELASEPLFAEGSVTLVRPNASGGAGVIKEGTRFRLGADPTASPEVKGARYLSTEPVYVDQNNTSATIPIRATASGADANISRYADGSTPAIKIDDTLYDATFTVSSSDAAGGSSGTNDVDLRRFAKAFYVGQYAPTDGALIAGALSEAGVKHVALVTDTRLGQTVLFIADQNWATSSVFLARCKSALQENWVGFGQRVAVRPIVNRRVALTAGVVLADPKFAEQTTNIGAAVRVAVRRYLDERPDFYTFDPNSLAATVASCDPRVLTCTSATLRNLATNDVIAPASLNPQSGSAARLHLTDNGVKIVTVLPA